MIYQEVIREKSSKVESLDFRLRITANRIRVQADKGNKLNILNFEQGTFPGDQT
jgi:hypothetical protein